MFGRRNFLSGLVTGGLIGAVIGMFARPQKKMEEAGRSGLLEGSREMVMRVGRGVTGIVRRRDRD